MVKVTGGSNKRVSLAALIATKPAQAPQLIYRVHKNRRRRGDQRKGFTETDYAHLFDAAHQQLSGPLVVVWDNLNTHVSAAMAELIVERHCGCLLGRRVSGIVCADDVGCLSPGPVSSLAAAPCRWGHA